MTSTTSSANAPTTRPRVPTEYQIPDFPSLYWPFKVPRESQNGHYLYNVPEIWRFTLLWTLIVYAIIYLSASLWAVAMQILSGTRRRWGNEGSLRYRASRKGKERSKTESEGQSAGSEATGIRTNENNNQTPTRKLKRRRKAGGGGGWLIWLIPLVYAFIAGIEAVISGTVVGLLLGSVYQAGYFKMSTWIPFIWALISALVLIISSFSLQGGL